MSPRRPGWSSPTRWRCGPEPRCPASTSATRSRSTSWSGGSAPTRSRTTRSARAGPWPKPSGGSRPTSATTRRTDRVSHPSTHPSTRSEALGRRIGSYAAGLWDMDGPLVDTEPYWITAEMELAERYDGVWSPEQALELVGSDLLDSGRYIRTHMGIDVEPEQ